MSDEIIEKAIASVIDIAASNFPSSTDISISTTGKNCASVTLPYYVLAGIMSLANQARTAREVKSAHGQTAGED